MIRTPKSGHESVHFLILLNYVPMAKRILTTDQIIELLKNPNVSSCSEKTMTYTKQFKLLAITLYERGSTSSDIFRKAGFDLDVIGRDQPKECVHRWNEIVRAKGKDGLSEQRGKNGRGGRPRTKGVTDRDRIERLEAEIAYLKLENDFLAKLRAKRAESNSGQNRNTAS